MAGRLGDILMARGLITEAQLSSALESQGSERGMLGMIFVRRGLITLEQLGEALSEQFDVPFRHVVPEAVDQQIVRLLPEDFSRQRRVVPIGVEDRSLSLAMVAPDDIETISEAELLTGYLVEPLVALEQQVQQSLDHGFDEQIVARQTIVDVKLNELESEDEAEVIQPEVVAEEETAPVVRLVKAILVGAINAGASDVHLEPHDPQMRVRYRLDGTLKQVMTIPSHIEEAVVARIKVMADMDTTENRKAQDGHLKIEDPAAKANLRVSTIPTVGGEKVVLRVLDEGNKEFRLDTLGLASTERARVQQLIDKPHGMIVVTGPTGSGKSTSMYAMLSSVNSVDRNIVTIEDPVEYRLPGINQVPADGEHGLGFADALKYIMRQDPDVIMVGEIRDLETATMAVQASLTGHLLISTLHTNDSVSAVTRLNDLGVDRFKIAGALLGSVAQRLLRSICPQCKEPCTPNEKLLESLIGDGPAPTNAVYYRGRGCRKCLNTGYFGRIPIFEVMLVTSEMEDAIERGAPLGELREISLSGGMRPLAQAGLERVLAGKTTIEEAFYKLST